MCQFKSAKIGIWDNGAPFPVVSWKQTEIGKTVSQYIHLPNASCFFPFCVSNKFSTLGAVFLFFIHAASCVAIS